MEREAWCERTRVRSVFLAQYTHTHARTDRQPETQEQEQREKQRKKERRERSQRKAQRKTSGKTEAGGSMYRHSDDRTHVHMKERT